MTLSCLTGTATTTINSPSMTVATLQRERAPDPVGRGDRAADF